MRADNIRPFFLQQPIFKLFEYIKKGENYRPFFESQKFI